MRIKKIEDKKKNKEYVRKSVVSIGSTSSYTPRSTTGSWLPPIKAKQKVCGGMADKTKLVDHTCNFGLSNGDKLSLLSQHKKHKWDYNKYYNSILIKKKERKVYFCKTCGSMKIVNKK